MSANAHLQTSANIAIKLSIYETEYSTIYIHVLHLVLKYYWPEIF